jgi:biogenesis of lysosome-related organelles complex 1 subunit 2
MAKSEVDVIHEAAQVLTSDVAQYMQAQTEELSETFELVFKLNQAAIGKYGELVEEAESLREKAKSVQEQELGVASLLGNLSAIEQDIVKLEQSIQKLENCCALLEQKTARVTTRVQ